jgi:hypothetical protein
MFINIIKFSSLTSVCVASLLLTGTAFAGSHAGSSSHMGNGGRMQSTRQAGQRTETPLRATRFGNTRNFDRNYHRTHGQSFRYGTYYQGRNHSHWSHYCWWPRFGCYAYYCPSTSCYYYWSETASCYYPVSYAETVTPTASTRLLNVDVNNNDNNVITTNAPASTPVGIPATRATGVGSELPVPTE